MSKLHAGSVFLRSDREKLIWPTKTEFVYSCLKQKSIRLSSGTSKTSPDTCLARWRNLALFLLIGCACFIVTSPEKKKKTKSDQKIVMIVG